MGGFDDLMAEVGDILGIEGYTPDAEGVCILESEEAEIRIIHCPEADEMLLLMATVMPLPPDGGRSLLAALDANHRFAGTRGSTVSLDAESDELVLSQYLPIDILTPRSFVVLLEAFSSALVALRVLDTEGQTPPPAVSDETALGKVNVERINLDGVVVELSQSENDGLIVALTDLGEAPADRTVARELLEANHLFAGTAGATLSLEAKSNRVFLQQKMYPVDGDEDWLPRRLAVFLDKASEWRARLQGVTETAGDAPSLDTSAFIKV
jgi:hypothetical protein